MDEKTINNFKKSIENMRLKVIEAKGESVEGLSKIVKREQTITEKSREAKS